MKKMLLIIFFLCIALCTLSSTALSLTYINFEHEALPYPNNIQAYLIDGHTFTQQGDVTNAMRCFKRARQLAEEKNDPQSMGILAWYYLSANDPKQAFNVYRRGNQLALQWARINRDYAMKSLKFLIDIHDNYMKKDHPQHSTSQALAKEAIQAGVDLETLRNAASKQPTDLQCTGKWLAGCKKGKTGTEYGYFNLKITRVGTINGKFMGYQVPVGIVESKVFKSNYRVSGQIDEGGEMLVHGAGKGGIVTMTGKLQSKNQGKSKCVGLDQGTFYLQRSNLQGIPCTVYEGTWETDK